MNTIRILFGALILLLVGGAIFLYYMGFFMKIRLEKKVMGPFTLIYKDHKGKCQDTAVIQDEIYDRLIKEYGTTTYKGVSIFLDDPKKVGDDQVRSKAGCLLEEKDLHVIEKIDNSELKVMKKEQGYYYVVQIPYKNKMSIFLGLLKAYPLIRSGVDEKLLDKNGVMEIYDIQEKKAYYLVED